MDVSKRQFLRGMCDTVELRPPWLINPSTFTEDCTRCGNCVDSCPQHILCAGDGGFPLVEFGLGECTFCGECTTRCEPGLFIQNRAEGLPAWHHKALVSERCLTNLGVMCRSCEDACEPRALRFPLVVGAVPGPVIDAVACTGCGACVKPCPEGAISMVSGI